MTCVITQLTGAIGRFVKEPRVLTRQEKGDILWVAKQVWRSNTVINDPMLRLFLTVIACLVHRVLTHYTNLEFHRRSLSLRLTFLIGSESDTKNVFIQLRENTADK